MSNYSQVIWELVRTVPRFLEPYDISVLPNGEVLLSDRWRLFIQQPTSWLGNDKELKDIALVLESQDGLVRYEEDHYVSRIKDYFTKALTLDDVVKIASSLEVTLEKLVNRIEKEYMDRSDDIAYFVNSQINIPENPIRQIGAVIRLVHEKDDDDLLKEGVHRLHIDHDLVKTVLTIPLTDKDYENTITNFIHKYVELFPS